MSSGTALPKTTAPAASNRPVLARPWRLLLWFLLGMALLAAAGLAIMPALILGDMVNMHVTHESTWSAPDFGIESQSVTLTTTDGLRLAAHEVPCESPKAVVVFLSGMHDPSVTAFFGHARLLREHQFASLLLELRAHGESEGERLGLGYTEHRDVEAAVSYLRERPSYADVPIVLFGLSMGGATAINSIGRLPEVAGAISLAAFSSVDDMFHDYMAADLPAFVAGAFRPFVRGYLTFTYGLENRQMMPREQIRNLGDRPALIVHSREDSQVFFANFERLMENAPDHVETWVRDNDSHFVIDLRGGFETFLRPEEDREYARAILGFLNGHFGA